MDLQLRAHYLYVQRTAYYQYNGDLPKVSPEDHIPNFGLPLSGRYTHVVVLCTYILFWRRLHRIGKCLDTRRNTGMPCGNLRRSSQSETGHFRMRMIHIVLSRLSRK